MNATPQQPIPPELLKDLSPEERDLLERVLRHHPKLTPAKALMHLRLAGM